MTSPLNSLLVEYLFICLMVSRCQPLSEELGTRRLEEHKQIPVLLYLSTVPIMIRKEIWSNTFDPLMSLYIDSHHINRCKPVSMMGLLSLFLLSMNANWIAHTGVNRPSQSLSSYIAPSAAVSCFFHWFSWYCVLFVASLHCPLLEPEQSC